MLWLLQAFLVVASGRDVSPRLRYLDLRCADRPIDLQPAFSPQQAVYGAQLDFAEPSFAVDAQPAEGADFVNMEDFSSTKLVAPGKQVISTLKVRNPESKEELDYSVTVQRLTGKETQLRDLRALGAQLEPAFAFDTEDYTVLMPAELDRLHIEAVLLDAGQTLEAFSSPTSEVHQWSSTSAAPLWDSSWEGKLKPERSDTSAIEPHTEVVSPDALKGRRLALSGELQRATVRRSFPVEVNGSRLVQLRVRAANGDAAQNRTYQLSAFRAPCPLAQPFYAPDVRLCAMTCNDGYFPREATSRCEMCSEHCVRCRSWDLCEVCEASQWQALHFLRLADGRCQLLRIPWRLLLLGGCAAIGVVSLCFCFLFACCWGSTSRPKRRKPVQDLEQEEQSQRLLGISGSDED